MLYFDQNADDDGEPVDPDDVAVVCDWCGHLMPVSEAVFLPNHVGDEHFCSQDCADAWEWDWSGGRAWTE